MINNVMKRQAVVVIHGIGEQKPMSTLREFVTSLSNHDMSAKPIRVYNIPDNISKSYELRQLSMYLGDDLRTDFFEYYWAYNLRGTKLLNIYAWIVQIMWRKPSNIPQRIRWIFYLLWLIACVYIAFIVSGLLVRWLDVDFFKGPLVVLIINAVVNVIAFVITFFLGDAARYTHPSPDNIEERSKIRKGGIDLLEKLHNSGQYSRIIVVGHSLGSMIGYDILKHYWAQIYKNVRTTAYNDGQILNLFNEKSKAGFTINESNRADYFNLQTQLLKEIQSRGLNWKISDFITLGSPLAYGQLLLAESKIEFEERVKQRELPSNPPAREDNGGISYFQAFETSRKSKQRKTSLEIIHHAGHFAFTHWHNLYYRSDFAGGDLAEVYGRGIRDIELPTESFVSKIPFAMHTRYWYSKSESNSVRDSKDTLKKIIIDQALSERS